MCAAWLENVDVFCLACFNVSVCSVDHIDAICRCVLFLLIQCIRVVLLRLLLWWVMVRFRVSFYIGVMIVLEDGGGAKEPGSYFRNFVCA